jgi:hypothetical protein
MNNVLRLQLAGEGARQPRGGSHGHALSMRNPETTQLDGRSTSSQRLFERLEAENARLRGDPPPLKWSDLRYVFDIKEDCNGKEAIQA